MSCYISVLEPRIYKTRASYNKREAFPREIESVLTFESYARAIERHNWIRARVKKKMLYTRAYNARTQIFNPRKILALAHSCCIRALNILFFLHACARDNEYFKVRISTFIMF